MKTMGNIIRKILFLIILALLVIPYLQYKYNLIDIEPLKGAIVPTTEASLNTSTWFSGAYQPQQEKYINESFGFRNSFIRINNQISFSLFKKAEANGVVVGKENYLYEYGYIDAYYGTDFIGTDSIVSRMNKLKYIQDTLSKLNKSIVLVFAAGKGTFYPEYFPNKLKTKQGITNYETYVQQARKLRINYIDFNSYFVSQKHTSKYPLYPQYGIHWSNYGICLAADSIVKYIEKIRHIDMPNFYWNKVENDNPKEGDYDIADALNIMVKLHSFKMAYPQIEFENDSGKTKPSVLVIADSFYWGMFGKGIITRSFSENHFWFYNKEVYPSSDGVSLTTDQLNLKDEIAKHDVIIIMCTEAKLPKLGWGFIENTYDYFGGSNGRAK